MCNVIPGSIQPTNKIMEELIPIDFGRYIALKYINSKYSEQPERIEDPTHQQYQKDNNYQDYKIIGLTPKHKIYYNKNVTKEIQELQELLDGYIRKFNGYISINTDHDEIHFHLILYCFWWVCNNDDGIIQYYKGINEIFKMFNGLKINDKTINTPIIKEQIPSKFEQLMFRILSEEFKVYNQEWAKNTCNPQNTYPDCGEVTARNLINLICFDGEKFNVELLPKTRNSKLNEYYEKFNTFDKQSNNIKETIDGREITLNARDEWSNIIINHASENIKFVKSCDDDYKKIRYELDAGLSTDGITGNFLQLIKNLLGITKWEDIINKFITKIQDPTINGI
jgi:hypothetical protein